MDKYSTWVGAATKVGGTLFIPGVENMSAVVVSCANSYESHEFEILSVRVGMGLGGGAGVSLVFIFNCLNLWDLNGKNYKDWGVNIAVTEKFDGIAKILANVPIGELKAMVKMINNSKKLVPKHAELLRNIASAIYSGNDYLTKNSAPALITLDIPVGVGLEISAHYLEGTIEVLS